MGIISLKKTIANLLRALGNTLEIEQVLERYLCPLQMFLELTENGFTAGAFKILSHDLTVKRIFLTRVTLKYLHNIAKTPDAPNNNHIQPAQNLNSWQTIISIPLFVFGVIFAIARAISRGSIKVSDTTGKSSGR
ncbi:MAG: hypothetical protein L7F77_06745 [Candidatus Magnetominusculus sp. LBB02]|nr:hypothetical protein [Candidatus Magnetominusculus sp. LBB02]